MNKLPKLQLEVLSYSPAMVDRPHPAGPFIRGHLVDDMGGFYGEVDRMRERVAEMIVEALNQYNGHTATSDTEERLRSAVVFGMKWGGIWTNDTIERGWRAFLEQKAW